MPSMVQVTDTTFNNLKVKSPSLITIKQAMDAVILTNQTLLIHDGYLTEEMVPTLFPLPGSWIEKLMETLQSAAHILNRISNKIVFATNDVKTSFPPMVARLRPGTVQANRTKKHSATSIKSSSILHTTNRIKWARQQLVFRVPCTQSPASIQAISPQTYSTLSAEELQQITMVVIQEQ